MTPEFPVFELLVVVVVLQLPRAEGLGFFETHSKLFIFKFDLSQIALIWIESKLFGLFDWFLVEKRKEDWSSPPLS